MESLPYVLEVGSQEVVLTPDPSHEFTATTEQVALGYGVSVEAIRSLKTRRGEELLEGKHWVVADRNTPGGSQQLTLWTKRGIVRLGFFIRSARARLFRDMAEDLVIGQMTRPRPNPDALVSARLIALATGQTGKAVGTMLKRCGVVPIAHYLEPRCRAAAYLWPMADVVAFFAAREEDYTFQAFTGEIRLGIAPVLRQVAHTPKGRATRPTRRPGTFLGMVNRVQAAQELAQLELRRYELMQALA